MRDTRIALAENNVCRFESGSKGTNDVIIW